MRIKNIVDIVTDRAPIGEKGRSINAIYVRARYVFNTLNNFIASADSQITDEHVEDLPSSGFTLIPQEKQVFPRSHAFYIQSFGS